MIVEPRERRRFGCSLCWVFCLHEDLKLEYKRIGSKKKKRIVRRFLSTQSPDVVML